ncbi:sensor histidine kinase [Coralloluteibacterium thermophilus]|uniref:Sensor histidine kinase n=1 Tax=Coralloluteibacterium thermophilum TaxID=2707049 RepID=A0ABV9NKN7_9GAMM
MSRVLLPESPAAAQVLPRPTPYDRHERAFRFWRWVSLGYLFFVALPMFFWREVPASAVVASLVAVLLYLPLHFLAFRRFGICDGWTVPALALAAGGIGLALVPINGGGSTFVIYALVFCGYRLRPRRGSLLCALLLAAYALQTLLIGGEWVNFLITLVVGSATAASGFWTQAQLRHDAELRLSHDEVRRLARMAERERIGRDLHDLLGHTLSLIALKSELAGRLVDRVDGDPGALRRARHEIGEVERVARDALGQVRRAVTGIRNAGLDAEIAATRLALLGADIELVVELAPLVLDADVETALAMALREATTNVLRHARATRMRIALQRVGGDAVLEIADDGRGGRHVPGNGLNGMRERLDAVGGTLRIEDAAPGTRLRLRVPVGVPAALDAPGG